MMGMRVNSLLKFSNEEAIEEEEVVDRLLADRWEEE